MNCIIVDDDETSRFVLSNLVSKITDLELIKACQNTNEAREVMKNIEIDLLLLDIEMPEETGVEFFETIGDNTDVVFITSQTKHAVSAFENDAVDYIVKPTNLARLKTAIEKAKRRRDKNKPSYINPNNEYLFIKEKGKLIKIFYSDILYVGATNGYVTFYLYNKELITSGVLKKVESKLNKKQFIRIHRSYIVNINKITAFDSEEISIGKKTIPLSRTYRKEVSKKLNDLMV